MGQAPARKKRKVGGGQAARGDSDGGEEGDGEDDEEEDDGGDEEDEQQQQQQQGAEKCAPVDATALRRAVALLGSSTPITHTLGHPFANACARHISFLSTLQAKQDEEPLLMRLLVSSPAAAGRGESPLRQPHAPVLWWGATGCVGAAGSALSRGARRGRAAAPFVRAFGRLLGRAGTLR